jgi:DNA repair exonuclease SbcCD ATPase subunit
MLETQLQQIQSGLARRGEVATELQKKQSDLGQLLPILERLSREAAGMQQELHQANQELHQLEMKIQALEFLKKQQAEKTSELERHRQERKKIQEEMLERTRVLETIENENRVIEEEQGRLARAQSDQKTAEREIAQLEERRALLHQVETAECPVCKKPLEAHEAADIEAEFEREITGQQERLLSAKSVEKEAKKSADDHKSVLISLNQKLMKLATPENQQQIEAKIAQLDDELQKLQQEIDVEGTLPGQIAGKKDQVEEIRKKISSLETTQGERIQEREGLDREIALLNNELQNLPQPGQAEHLQKAIEECIREAAEQGKLVGLLQSAPEALRKAQEELVQLGNPIGLQANSAVLRTAGRLWKKTEVICMACSSRKSHCATRF